MSKTVSGGTEERGRGPAAPAMLLQQEGMSSWSCEAPGLKPERRGKARRVRERPGPPRKAASSCPGELTNEG